MRLQVPELYAKQIKIRRVGFLLILLLICCSLAWLVSTAFSVGGCAITCVGLINVILNYRRPLFYDLDDQGICLSTVQGTLSLNGLNGCVARYWIDWSKNPLEAFDLTHWQQFPALLLVSSRFPQGRLMPIYRQDVERVVIFLETQVSLLATCSGKH